MRRVSGLRARPTPLLFASFVSVVLLAVLKLPFGDVHAKPMAIAAAGLLHSVAGVRVVTLGETTREAWRNGDKNSNKAKYAGFLATQETAARVYVGVVSHSGNSLRRHAIREGWGADPALYRVRFFLLKTLNESLAQQVEAESLTYEDVVILPLVPELYRNLGNTTMEILRFATLEPLVTHVLKVDDDMYMRPQLLLNLLPMLPTTNLYLGEFVRWWCKSMSTAECGVTPPPKDNTLLFFAAPYACGGAYLLSVDLARAFAAVATFNPQISSDGTLKHESPYSMCLGNHPILTPFKLEDMMVGCWMDWRERSANLTINRVHEPRFQIQKKECSEDAIAMHGYSSDRQRCMTVVAGHCDCDDVTT